MDKRETNRNDTNPTIAPSMEMDELELEASKKEKDAGDYTEVTKLVVDRTPE
jgi:hypothetical protein